MKISELKKYFLDKNKSNAIGHAYLFSNVNYGDIEEIIKNIVNTCFFSNSNLEFEFNPDIYIIESEKDQIKKEKILELESNLSITSQINNNKLYIIKECDKLNASAANCLLKTLEEPKENIYAFLFTSNFDAVMPTIKSRCQIIKMEKLKNSVQDIEQLENAIKFIKTIEKYKTQSILYYNSLHKDLDKKNIKDILILVEKFYKDCLNAKYNLNLENFSNYIDEINNVNSKNDEKMLLLKMKVLNNNISMLKYNLNIGLFLDKLFIEFGRVYEQDCRS